MEIDNIVQNIPFNPQSHTHNFPELSEMPTAPRLSPMEVPLSMYLDMRVFYLEESDAESYQSQRSSDTSASKRRMIKKSKRKERKNTNATQADECEQSVI